MKLLTINIIVVTLLLAILQSPLLAQTEQSSPDKVVPGIAYEMPDISPSLGAPMLSFDEPSRAFIIAKRSYERQIRKIRYQYLSRNKQKHEPTLQHGLDELSQFTDPASIVPLVDVLRGESDRIRDWLIHHLQTNVETEYGQSALAWMSIYEEDETTRDAARNALAIPAEYQVQIVIDDALRSKNHRVVAGAAITAQTLKLTEAIPLLITAQAANTRRTESQGDLAWIQFGTQRFFVVDLQPVVGNNSAGFDPQLGIIQEGTVLVIQDAVVEIKRYEVHNALRNIIKDDIGKDINFGFNIPAWKKWYENEYLASNTPTASISPIPTEPDSP